MHDQLHQSRQLRPAAREQLLLSLLILVTLVGMLASAIVTFRLTWVPAEREPLADIALYDDSRPQIVRVGQQVTWTNIGGQIHTVTAQDGSFDSGLLRPRDSWSLTPRSPGTIIYFCRLHPGLVGRLIVE